jgi:hypothetical protein
LLSLTYFSCAHQPWTDDDLVALLGSARARNDAVGITGMLLYSGRNFVQTLEGASDAVDARFTLIDSDLRHRDVFIVSREEIRAREFGQWPMGFGRVTGDQVDRTPGFADYLANGRIASDAACRSAVVAVHDVFRTVSVALP